MKGGGGRRELRAHAQAAKLLVADILPIPIEPYTVCFSIPATRYMTTNRTHIPTWLMAITDWPSLCKRCPIYLKLQSLRPYFSSSRICTEQRGTSSQKGSAYKTKTEDNEQACENR